MYVCNTREGLQALGGPPPEIRTEPEAIQYIEANAGLFDRKFRELLDAQHGAALAARWYDERGELLKASEARDLVRDMGALQRSGAELERKLTMVRAYLGMGAAPVALVAFALAVAAWLGFVAIVLGRWKTLRSGVPKEALGFELGDLLGDTVGGLLGAAALVGAGLYLYNRR